MFTENLFAFVLEQLGDEIAGREIPTIVPFQTDSFIARSVMQKAIRRGMTELALRAAATLMMSDRRVLWRRLVVTALEDLGVGEVDLLARIVAASRDRVWREKIGGEWLVVSALIEQACAGTRCQSANDLFNVAQNDPDLDNFKLGQCDANLSDLLNLITDEGQPIGCRGAAVLLALGEDAGPASPTHIPSDAGAVFAAFAEAGRYSHVATIYQEAFRHSGLALAPLSLCLWRASNLQVIAKNDDEIPQVTWTGEIPSFALDQYTRGGQGAIRRYIASSSRWREFAERRKISKSDWAKAAGELLFRTEGALVTNRRTWDAGQQLYKKSVGLGCFMPIDAVSEGMTLIRAELPLIDGLRKTVVSPIVGG